jgi:two-component system, cell cycle sensor histidine kinase and response regulator CckA
LHAVAAASLGGSVLFHSLEWYRTRRRMEAAKRVADARIREQAALIDKAQDAILVGDLEGRITYANPGAEKLYGWSLEDLRSGAHGVLFNDPPAQKARRLTLVRGEWNGELNHQSRSGRVLRIESRWTLLRDEDRRAHGLLMIHSDVTEKRQLEAEAVRMQRMEALGSLAGGMAHDLNNALAPILMGAQLLRRDSKNENVRRVLALMESSTRRGADMVRQVLLFARGRHGEFEPVNVSALVKEMTKLAQDTFPKGIVVSAHVAEDLWLVCGDATQLHQVLLNLCVNARDAMPDGGALSLAADNVALDAPTAATLVGGRTGEFVVLMASDSGTGMSPEVMARVFEPFFTTKPEGKGTGLGLSTAARIVKAHGGFIAVQSEPGEGTTFEVYLPRLTQSVPEESLAASAPPPRGQGELILVAEDDAAVRELLKRSLEEHGYRILAATNGAEAVSIFKAQPDAVVLLVSDCSMPLLDGPQAVAVMRELKHGIARALAWRRHPGGAWHRGKLTLPAEADGFGVAVA